MAKLSPKERMAQIVTEYKQSDEYKQQQAKEQKEQAKNAYKGRILQNKVSRRIKRIKNDPTSSIFSANAYDNWLAMYKAGPSWEKSTPERIARLTEQLNSIDTNQTSRIKGAREHHRQATGLMGSSYTSLTREQQSKMWDEFNTLKSRYKNLESDQIASLVKYGNEVGGGLIPETDFTILYDEYTNAPRIEFLNNNLDLDKQKAILRQTRREWGAIKRPLE